MTPQAQRAALELDIVAALAAKLALDLREGRLWPGDASRVLEQMRAALSNAETGIAR